MFIIKVLLHHVLFLLLCTSLYYYFDLNICFTVVASFHVYVASYFVSLWTIKLIFLFPFTKVRTENKCVFITGCDTGFGNEAALLLNKIGFKVFASCLDSNSKGAIHLMEKSAYPTKMIVIKMDVTHDKDIESAFEIVKSSMTNSEHLFGLVNNAGIAMPSELEFGPDLTNGQKVIDVNTMGTIKVTRQFLPLIRQAKGRVINIESMAALLPIQHGVFYGTSKAGAGGFSDNLRIGMYMFDVSVISINPFFYKNPINDEKMLVTHYENSFRSSSQEVRDAYGENFMLKAKNLVSSTKYATQSSAVPDVIVSALTVYEPDPRYIVAPIYVQPSLRLLLWLPKETLEVYYQLISWFFGTHKAYPDIDKNASPL